MPDYLWDFLNPKQQDNTTVTPSQGLRPSVTSIRVVESGTGGTPVVPRATGADVARILGYVDEASKTFKTSKETYSRASDKFAVTESLKDDLKAAKKFLASIEDAQEDVAKGFTELESLVWDSQKARTIAVGRLTAEEKKLDAQAVKYTKIIDDLTEQIAKEEPTTTYTFDKKTNSNLAPLLSGTTPPPVVNQNTSPDASGSGVTSDVTADTAKQTLSKPASGLQLTYNVGTVKDAYFSTNKDYLKQTTYRGNQPTQIAKASQLWRNAGNHKGMFVMTNPVKNTSGIAPAKGDPGGGAGWSYEAAWVKWGFQFMYNPATVSMNYVAGPSVDYAYLASGQGGTNLMGTDGSFGTISFELIINRMFDMKYFNKNGSLTEAGKEQYGQHVPTYKEQYDIYNKGTMYDVEYLLRTAGGGVTIQNTWLRQYTADLGYVAALPIELHLGKNLRYWGAIANIELNHTIFNEKMVPIFTSVQITFSRLIEPPKKPVGR